MSGRQQIQRALDGLHARRYVTALERAAMWRLVWWAPGEGWETCAPSLEELGDVVLGWLEAVESGEGGEQRFAEAA